MKSRALLLVLLFAACTPRISHSPRIEPPRNKPLAKPEERERQEPGIMHLIVPGESWESLAQDYYGKAQRADKLREANARLGGELSPGDQVFIPLDPKEREAFERRGEARGPYNRGLALAEQGDYPAAILEFREATERDEGLAAAHYNLGLVYRRTGELDLAEASLAKAARLEPRRADYQSARGINLHALGREREAEEAFRRALDLDPQHLPSLYALARLLSEGGHEDEARPYWRRYLQLAPGGQRGEEAREHLKEKP